MRAYVVIFLVLSGFFLSLAFNSDIRSTYDYYLFRRKACKTSLKRTAQALVHEKSYKNCLIAAQRKVYKSGSKIRNKLKRYPEGLQRIFLEALNRRLDQGRSYKSTIHPLNELTPIIEDYFIHKKSLESWWNQRDEILSNLEKNRTTTPCHAQINYLSLNKLLHEKYAAKNNDHSLHKEISKLYNLLAKLHFNGIDVCLDKFEKLWKFYVASDSVDLQQLPSLITEIRPQIKTLYKACYYPPTLENAQKLKKAVENLLNQKTYKKNLETLAAIVQTACLEKETNKAACANVPNRFENLTIMKQIIQQLQYIDHTFSQPPK